MTGLEIVQVEAEPRLTVELVPRTCWYSNVRTNVSSSDWAICKAFVRERSGNRCEICGGRGRKWPVECHEVWDYEHVHAKVKMLGGDFYPAPHGIQRLEGLIALCPACHEVKHAGRAEAIGRLGPATAHLAEVNGWSIAEARHYLRTAFDLWAARSRLAWTLDISYLSEVLEP